MNQSRSSDPLRFLKKMKSRTPSKVSKQSSKANTIMNDSLAMMESKLQETLMLKENCYDPNKYYSSKCQQYLSQIGYQSKPKKQLPTLKKATGSGSENAALQFLDKKQREERQKDNEQDSLTGILLSKEKEQPKISFPQGDRELTFKKIDFEKSSSLGMKQQARRLQMEPQTGQFQAENQQEQVGKLEQCSGCGRKFNSVSYVKHARICNKVFGTRRKQFSSEKQRSQSRESKEIVKR